jgi:hypothetical protein
VFYEYALTIPANTPRATPAEQLVTLALGEITWWEVQFPDGCDGLVHVYVRDELHQVIPANTDGDVSANNEHVDSFDSIPLADEPATLIVGGWNDDDTFPHTITFRFAVRSETEMERVRVAFDALAFLDQWFSRGQPAPAS